MYENSNASYGPVSTSTLRYMKCLTSIIDNERNLLVQCINRSTSSTEYHANVLLNSNYIYNK